MLTVSVCVNVCVPDRVHLSAGSMLSQAESSLPSYSSLSVFSSGVQVEYSFAYVNSSSSTITETEQY